MSVYLSKKSPYYRFDFESHGCRYHGSTKQTNLRDAEKFEKGERGRANDVRRARVPPVSLTIGDVALHFWRESGRNEPRWQHKWNDFKRLVEWFDKYVGPMVLLGEITNDHVAEIMDWRRIHRAVGHKATRDEEISPISHITAIKTVAEPLKRIFAYAKREWGVIFKNEPDWSAYLR